MKAKTEEIPDETRETMFFASIHRRLTKPKVVISTVDDPFTLDEVKQVMLDKSPVSIYVLPYSSKQPCIHITKRIMPSHNGVFLYYDAWADKTPKHYTWKEFYRELKSVGLENIRY